MELVLLSAAAFVSAAVTGALGVGGGLILIVLMAQIVPPVVLIPMHAGIMLFSNFGRAYIQRHSVRWDYVKPFLLGTAMGAAVLAPLVSFAPQALGQLVLGVFVLVMTWRAHWFRLQAWKPAVSGGVTGGLTLFLGATGPMVMSVLPRAEWPKAIVVGTHGAAMMFQHGVKFVVFLFLGFSPGDWAPAMVGMCLATIAGNLLGARLLSAFSEKLFKTVIDWVLTLLAIRLIWQAMEAL